MVKVEEIGKDCVKDDCVLVMIPFTEGLEISDYNTGEQIFYFTKNDHKYINKYLEDERKIGFPNSNIPFHKAIKNFKIYNVAHQILNYGTIYKIGTYKKNIIDHTDMSELSTVEKVVWERSDYKYYTCFASVIRDGDEALFVVSNKVVPELEMTPEELKSLKLLNKVKFSIFNSGKAISKVSSNKTEKNREEVKRLSKKLK